MSFYPFSAPQGWGVTNMMATSGTTILTPYDYSVIRVSGSLPHTLILPLASGLGTGVSIVFGVINQTSATLTLQRTGTDQIEGNTSVNITSANRNIIMSDGAANWFQVAGGPT